MLLYRIANAYLSFVLAILLATGTESMAQERSAAKPLRVGLIGLDTSHSVAFTKLLNAPSPPANLANCQVVVAYPYGSRDIESSTSRIPGYTEDVRKLGVQIVDSVEAVVAACDVVLLETNDGRPHLEQVIPVLKAHKPVFVDKPVAASLVDAIAIFEAAKHYDTPLFSASSLRFMDDAQAARAGQYGTVYGCDAYSPCSLEKTHPSLFWYGIHGVEILFTVMGPDCESVSRTSTPDADVVVGVWKDGRIGTFRGMRAGKSGYGGNVFAEKEVHSMTRASGYEPLVVEIVKFFRSGEAPVSADETLAIYGFMAAADVSREQGGAPVSVTEVMHAARLRASVRLREVSAP